MSLQPVSFDWKSEYGGYKNKYGFIAEQVGAIMPDAVNWSKEESGKADGYDQAAILAVVVKSLQDALGHIKELKAEIDALKGKCHD